MRLYSSTSIYVNIYLSGYSGTVLYVYKRYNYDKINIFLYIFTLLEFYILLLSCAVLSLFQSSCIFYYDQCIG